MATTSRVTTWSSGDVLTASALNGEFNNLLTGGINSIANANIASDAAIATSKINTTFPSGTIVGTSDSQTLTNKTLTSPTINSATIASPTITSPTVTGTIAGGPTITKPTINGSIQAYTTDSDGATVTFDMAASNIHTVTLAGNRTLAVSNVSVGQAFVIRLVQDGTGSRTVTWFSTLKWAAGVTPTLTTTASKTDVFGFLCTSANNYDAYIVGQNL